MTTIKLGDLTLRAESPSYDGNVVLRIVGRPPIGGYLITVAEWSSLESAAAALSIAEGRAENDRREIVRLDGEVARLRAEPESWRQANHRWQIWGDRVRRMIGSDLNGDESTRDAIEAAIRGKENK